MRSFKKSTADTEVGRYGRVLKCEGRVGCGAGISDQDTSSEKPYVAADLRVGRGWGRERVCVSHLLLLVLLALPAFAGCGKEKAAPPAPQPVVLGPEDTAVVTEGPIETGPALTGTLTPEREAVLRSQIAGSVLAVSVQPGEPVRQGQTLARLDSAALTDAYTSARAAVTSAQSNLGVVRRQAERQRALVAAGAVARREVETAQQEVVAAQAALAQARAALASASKQLAYTGVTAPFSGVVSDRPVSEGDVVQPGTPLMTVVDPSSLELEASVPAEELGALRVGAPVEFTVNGYAGRTFQGIVTRINPSADPATRQVRVYAEIPNPGNTLVAGLYTEGRVESQQRTALVLPAAAIDRRSLTPAVLAVRDGKVTRVEVELGLVDERGQRVEIRSGLLAGEVVLEGPAQSIQPGTPVQLAPGVLQQTERLAAAP